MALIYQGAEAEIRTSTYLGREIVEKKRIPKSYRLDVIDSLLRSSRTKGEAKLMLEARSNGVPVPLIYDVNLEEGIIKMEYIKGDRVKDILNELNEEKRAVVCQEIGRSIARLHENDLIHGDITTSNMLLLDNKIHFIDFGLGEKNGSEEAKGVDLHVLMEAFESTHSQHARCFEYVLDAYKKELPDDAPAVIKKIKEIVRRGRYRK